MSSRGGEEDVSQLTVLEAGGVDVVPPARHVLVEDLGHGADEGAGAGHHGEGDKHHNEAGGQVEPPDDESAGAQGGAGAAVRKPRQRHHPTLEQALGCSPT